MSAIWSSSERPISVRMVWVDGIRHAILSQDDPLLGGVKTWQRQRPRTSPTTKHDNYNLRNNVKPANDASSSFDGCFVKLHLLSEKSEASEISNLSRSVLPCGRIDVCSSDDSDELEDVDNMEAVVPSVVNCVSPKTSNNSDVDLQTKEKSTSSLSTLSERVLQWLDLSGRVRNFDLENTPREVNFVKTSSASSRRKFVNFKEEGSCMKIVLPTQCFMIQQSKSATKYSERSKSIEFSKNIDDTRDQLTRALYVDPRNKNSSSASSSKLTDLTRALYVDPRNKNSSSASSSKLTDRQAASESMWTLPEKPQLHIFMPSFKPTQIQWMSSQESVSCK